MALRNHSIDRAELTRPDLDFTNLRGTLGKYTVFASWTDEPESEVVDAFTIPSWNQSVCQCCLSHRETCFIFPPV